jgi:hypothetical protein
VLKKIVQEYHFIILYILHLSVSHSDFKESAFNSDVCRGK